MTRDVPLKGRVTPAAAQAVRVACQRCGCSMSEMFDLLFRALSAEAIAEVVRDQRAIDAEERDRCSRPTAR